MKTTITTVLVALWLAIPLGCANLVVGHPIDNGKVSTIVPGRSNKDFIKNNFGAPLHTVNGPDGDIWTYRYLNGRGGAQELTLSFNGDVVSVMSTE